MIIAKKTPKETTIKNIPHSLIPRTNKLRKMKFSKLEISVSSGVGGLQANAELLRGLGLVSLLRRIHKGAFQKMAEVPTGPGGGERICIISQDLG